MTDKDKDEELIIIDDFGNDIATSTDWRGNHPTALDLTNIGGGGGSMYDPYIYTGAVDTITLSGIDDIFNNDLNVSGDIKVDGVSLKNWMENVNKRLAILEPKPELLKKYAALQKAYEHYKTLEALLHNADKINPPN